MVWPWFDPTVRGKHKASAFSQSPHFSDEKPGSQRDRRPTWSHSELVVDWKQASPQGALDDNLSLLTQPGLTAGGGCCLYTQVC